MKIGIDISQSIYRGTGVARFTTGLAHAICTYGKGHEWHFFFSAMRHKPDPYLLKRIAETGHAIHILPVPKTVLTNIWNRLHIVPIDTFIPGLDWFITSDWTEPPARCKKTTIIHDLAYLRHPETVANSIRSVQKSRMYHVKKESEFMFADSEATKTDIVELLRIKADRVVVNYPAVEDITAAKETVSTVIKKYNITKPFILTVGKIEPRKNIARLIEAFNTIDSNDTELLIVGEKGWGATPHSDSRAIRFLGYVSDDELAALYSLCEFFVFPSMWEGFGYPVVEAMRAGAAVATSNTSSLKEIGSTAAVLFDPYDIQDIARALTELLHNDAKRGRLAQKGKVLSARYTWKTYYDTLISSLRTHS